MIGGTHSVQGAERMLIVRPAFERDVGVGADMVGNQPAMVAAGLDEDFVRIAARCDDARNIQTGHVRLHRRRIIDGLVLIVLQADTARLQQLAIGTEAGQGEHEVTADLLCRAVAALNAHLILGNMDDAGVVTNMDSLLGELALQNWADPRLDIAGDLCAAIDDGYLGAYPLAFERGIDGRIAAADDDDLHAGVRMCLLEIMGDMRKILARDAQEVRIIEIAGRNDNMPAAVSERFSAAGLRMQLEGAVLILGDILDLFIGADAEPILLRHSAVIDERFVTVRLLIRGRERDAADFQQFRGAEELEMGRITVDGMYDALLLDNERIPPAAL